jgi:protein-S-isoprenylcysteine O-methyltransferase Ste14
MMAPPFWLILMAVLAWGLLHSFLASLKVKAQVKHWISPEANHWYRIIYNLIAIITFLPILLLFVILPDKVIYTIHYPWVILTSVIQLLALVILMVGMKQTGVFSFLGFRQLISPEDNSSPVLVTTGLYKYVRHPLYTAGLAVIWFIPYISLNLLALNLGITIYIIIGAYIEERKLNAEYGPEYIEYSRQTPMLIPGLRIPFQKG